MAASPPNAPGGDAGIILERGHTIDRFVVLGLVGRGGMGEVYAAYDPELDRKVAIKLLRARGDTADGKTRLLREAQAIAKLQHPNVVVVYDVGTFGESVFIAMEFVEGRTVGGWLHSGTGPRTRREILDVYLAAGRGLAAAHAAGLVHRDFKPDNVMVTNDGQVRVMDFGLARPVGEAATEANVARERLTASRAFEAETLDPSHDPDATVNLGPPGAGDLRAASGKYLSVKLTQTGAMLGTPAYMAPEQFAVQPTDARTDQFSFCVALYEALYGERPFEGTTFLTLMTSVSTGAVKPAPAKQASTSRVPGWMRRVLLRGLETRPASRFASMTTLLGALQTDPNARARRVVTAVGVSLCVAVAAVGASRAVGTKRNVCDGGAGRLAGIWEPRGVASARKEAVHRAFLATETSYAEASFASASRLLDHYVEGWVSMYGEACEATQVRAEQSAEVLDLRMSCLRERLTAVRALGDVFASADSKVVENAVVAAGALPRLESCADVAVLKAVVKPPGDEATRRQVDALRVERARLVALRDSGKCADAINLADDLLPRARALGYQPLLAEVLLAAVFPRNECIETRVAIPRLREAFNIAVASRDDEVAAEAATNIAGLSSAIESGDPATSREWVGIARAANARIGGRPLFEAWLVHAEAGIYLLERNLPAALAAFKRSRDAKVRISGEEHPDVFISDADIGLVLGLAGRYTEAVAVEEATRAVTSRTLGPESPQVAIISNNEGEVLNILRRHEEARVRFEQALSIWRKSGADPMFVSYGLTGLGIALVGEGRAAEAVPSLEDALQIRVDKQFDEEHLGETRFALARALWVHPAQRERARELARQALADYAQVKQPTAPVPDVAAWLRTSTPNI